jgi:hypothetical protein
MSHFWTVEQKKPALFARAFFLKTNWMLNSEGFVAEAERGSHAGKPLYEVNTEIDA